MAGENGLGGVGNAIVSLAHHDYPQSRGCLKILSIYIYPNLSSLGLENLVTEAPMPFCGIVGEERTFYAQSAPSFAELRHKCPS